MKQAEIQTKLSINNNHLNKQKDNHPFHRVGQLRRAKMHAARLIDVIDSKGDIPILYATSVTRSKSFSGNNRF